MMNRPRRKPDYCLEMMEGELLLYHPVRTRILYCNETASLVWQLCDGGRSVAEITALLTAVFPEAAETVPEDVAAVLQTFLEHGVIEYV